MLNFNVIFLFQMGISIKLSFSSPEFVISNPFHDQSLCSLFPPLFSEVKAFNTDGPAQNLWGWQVYPSNVLEPEPPSLAPPDQKKHHSISMATPITPINSSEELSEGRSASGLAEESWKEPTKGSVIAQHWQTEAWIWWTACWSAGEDQVGFITGAEQVWKKVEQTELRGAGLFLVQNLDKCLLAV